jgi:hypothetical protein
MAVMLLPCTAEAQGMREFGAFAVTHGFASDGRGMAGYDLGNLPGSGFGNPQASPVPAAWGNGGTVQAGYGWLSEPTAAGGVATADMRRAFGSAGIATSRETAQATFLAMRQFTQTLLDPAVDGRDIGPAGFDAELSAYAAMGNNQRHGGIGRDSYASFYGRPALALPRWNVWAAGFISSQVAAGNVTSSSRSYGTVTGADYWLSPRTRVGFALAGGGTGFANEAASGRSDLFQAGAFVRHAVDAAYIAGALGYGWQAIYNDYRPLQPGSAEAGATINANAYSARIESGYRLPLDLLGAIPYAAAQITTFRLPSGPAAGSDAFTETRGELGLRTSTSFGFEDGVISLRSRVAWLHHFDAKQQGSAPPQSLPFGSLPAGDVIASAGAVVTSMALELRTLKGWSASANVESEISSLLRSYTGRAALRYAW